MRLRDIAAHDGQPSYRKMAYTYVNRRGVTKVLYFTFSVLPGGSMPAWDQPGAGCRAGARPGWPSRRPSRHAVLQERTPAWPGMARIDRAWSTSSLVGTVSRSGSWLSWACLIIALRIMARVIRASVSAR